jgi:DHA2 family methylenomycin A resistance protein-like MFS transporter
MLSGGALSDRFGAARVFTSGIVIFGTGSLIDAVALNFPLLLLGRVVQGVGGALCMPSGLAVLRASVPPRLLGRAIALWTFSASVAISVGPVMSGAFVQFWTWRSIFLINVPIVALAVHLILPEARNPRQRTAYAPNRTVDFVGQVLYAVSFSLFIGGVIFLRGEVGGFRWPVPVTLLAVSAGGLIAFFLCERRPPNRWSRLR